MSVVVLQCPFSALFLTAKTAKNAKEKLFFFALFARFAVQFCRSSKPQFVTARSMASSKLADDDEEQ